ncbi:serine hydrolase domain-containing protein [Legionella spiritensis]|uniref:D-alanyl-D-alanine carboxypeptidase n=1 Tax=Legionella spiritensis TaxID=452 RepID=A0A0W0Z701_LEGSP|nr:serine hydrolase domain-containing protein [Legionella spiritensis]KTD64534.1 D-alanyl-D-alanine carboxypeptidase [Legionella spiritensis]SNV29902.1 D-alanyl-D-alanine carboxypeptidase [Legionella spiritensis]
MRNKIVFFSFITLFLFYTSACTAISPVKNGEFQHLIDEFRIANHIGAITLAVSFPGETAPRLFNSGETETGNGIPANIGSLVQIGSLTKSFIAAMILKQEERGALSLNDKLGTWLPEYPDWADVSIRQLLNHTSGIYNYTDSEEFRHFLLANPDTYLKPDTLIHYAAQNSPYFAPGAGWHYSNTGYVLLGKILEKITRKPLDILLNDTLHDNLRVPLNNTFFVPHLCSKEIRQRIIHGYYFFSPDQPLDITDYSLSWMNSAGGLVSNTYDLTNWIRALFSGKILQPQSFARLTELVSIQSGQPLPQVNGVDTTGYGLGIQACKTTFANLDTIWWHSGGTAGYKTLMMWLPNQKIAIAVSFNQVMSGQEAVPLSPDTVLPSAILRLISEHT